MPKDLEIPTRLKERGMKTRSMELLHTWLKLTSMALWEQAPFDSGAGHNAAVALFVSYLRDLCLYAKAKEEGIKTCGVGRVRALYGGT
jgi:hypothetical protein